MSILGAGPLANHSTMGSANQVAGAAIVGEGFAWLSGSLFVQQRTAIIHIDGQPDTEYGFPRLRGDFNVSPVFVDDDVVADVQAQPGAYAGRLGGEEWLK